MKKRRIGMYTDSSSAENSNLNSRVPEDMKPSAMMSPVASSGATSATAQTESEGNDTRRQPMPSSLRAYTNEELKQYVIDAYRKDQISLLTSLFSSVEVRRQITHVLRSVSTLPDDRLHSQVSCVALKRQYESLVEIEAVSDTYERFCSEFLTNAVISKNMAFFRMLKFTDLEREILKNVDPSQMDAECLKGIKEILGSLREWICALSEKLYHTVHVKIRKRQFEIIQNEIQSKGGLLDELIRKQKEIENRSILSRSSTYEKKEQELKVLFNKFNAKLNDCMTEIESNELGQVEIYFSDVLGIIAPLKLEKDLCFRSYSDVNAEEARFTSTHPDELTTFFKFFKTNLQLKLRATCFVSLELNASMVISEEKENALMWKKPGKDQGQGVGGFVLEEIDTKHLIDLLVKTEIPKAEEGLSVPLADQARFMKCIREAIEKHRGQESQRRRHVLGIMREVRAQLIQFDERCTELFNKTMVPESSTPRIPASSPLTSPQTELKNFAAEDRSAVSEKKSEEMKKCYRKHYDTFYRSCFKLILPSYDEICRVVDKTGNTFLHYFFEVYGSSKEDTGQVKVLQSILEQQPALYRQNKKGLTHLSYMTSSQSIVCSMIKTWFEKQGDALHFTLEGLCGLLDQGIGISHIFPLIQQLSISVLKIDRHNDESLVKLIEYFSDFLSKELRELNSQKITTPFLKEVLTILEDYEKTDEENATLSSLPAEEQKKIEEGIRQRRFDCRLLRLCCLSITEQFFSGRATTTEENALAELIFGLGKNFCFESTLSDHRLFSFIFYGALQRFNFLLFTSFFTSTENKITHLSGVPVIPSGLCGIARKQLEKKYPSDVATLLVVKNEGLLKKIKTLEEEKKEMGENHGRELQRVSKEKDEEIKKCQASSEEASRRTDAQLAEMRMEAQKERDVSQKERDGLNTKLDKVTMEAQKERGEMNGTLKELVREQRRLREQNEGLSTTVELLRELLERSIGEQEKAGGIPIQNQRSRSGTGTADFETKEGLGETDAVQTEQTREMSNLQRILRAALFSGSRSAGSTSTSASSSSSSASPSSSTPSPFSNNCRGRKTS